MRSDLSHNRFRRFEKMRGVYSALAMAFKPALITAQPFFEALHGRVDAAIGVRAIPGRLHIEARLQMNCALSQKPVVILFNTNLTGDRTPCKLA